ncbi:MAG: putative T7SS-secreted protein, partial [Pseudonocardiaceae bacterium]
MGEFPAYVFRLGGDPGAIRSSAGKWSEFGTAASEAAGQITALDTSEFVGPEGDLFREGLNESMPGHLRITGEAFGKVAGSLNGFAGSLSGLQARMGPLAARAPGLWEALQQAQGRVADARSADQAHARDVAARPPEQAGAPDTYQSDTGAASTALSGAQRAWQDCVDAANGVRSELVTAVDSCVRVVDEATGMRFKENPKWFDLGGQFENFVRDNKELLQQLSGALKIVSLVAGVLSFIPFLAPVMVPLALGTALAASAIDLSIYAATGEGSLRTVLIDVGLNLLPGVGKLA